MRNLMRVPVIPLDYNVQKNISGPRELLVDYINKKAYVKSPDGQSFIDLNETSDTHVQDGSIHVTLEQKNKWTQDIITIFEDIEFLNEAVSNQDSPDLTGIPTAPTAEATTNTTQIATTAFVQAAIKIGDCASVGGKTVNDLGESNSYLWTAGKIISYVANQFAANDAMVFKGTLGIGGKVEELPAEGYNAGWTYRVITAGTYAGNNCEIGDLIVCVNDYSSETSSNQDWSVSQTNIDGAVVGSSTSVNDGDVPIFDGTTGKIIKTSGKSFPSGNIVGDTSYGDSTTGGVVKSSPLANKVAIDGDGTMTVNTINPDKGGTGLTSVSKGSMIYASSNNTFAEVETSEFGRSLLNATTELKLENLDADKVDGLHVGNTGIGEEWGYIPAVNESGSMDIGNIIDFHNSSNDGTDYSYRLTASEDGLTGSDDFNAPVVKATDKFNINDKAHIRYNSIDDTIEFVFA